MEKRGIGLVTVWTLVLLCAASFVKFVCGPLAASGDVTDGILVVAVDELEGVVVGG